MIRNEEKKINFEDCSKNATQLKIGQLYDSINESDEDYAYLENQKKVS